MATWRSDEEAPLFRDLRRVAERRLGEIVDVRHSFGDAAALEGILADAGFEDIRTRRISRTIRIGDAGVFLRLNAMAMIGMSAKGKELDGKARAGAAEAIARDSAEAMRPYVKSDGLAFEISTNLATGRRG